jgi:hypothetical protein
MKAFNSSITWIQASQEAPVLRAILISGLLLTTVPVSVYAKPPGHEKQKKIPPGLAKKGGLPPGLAKKFGRHVPPQPYVAFDPGHTDRAWFLINGHWELKTGLTGSLKVEIQDSLKLPIAPPPVPLPNVGVDLHVVLFQ